MEKEKQEKKCISAAKENDEIAEHTAAKEDDVIPKRAKKAVRCWCGLTEDPNGSCDGTHLL